YSTQDADSEGEEGKFFVWSAAEVESVLGSDLATVFNYAYDVSADGNWEGHNILNRTRRDDQDARLLRMCVEELQKALAEGRAKLLAVRERRVKPGRDEKALTSWNGLMIGAFGLAAQILDRPDYAQTAVRAAQFILTRMRGPDGRLLRTYSAGSSPKLNAYLEDYSYLLDSLVTLYETTFDSKWIVAALEIAEIMRDQFWDEKEGGFFYTGKDHEALIARTKDPHDSSVPSGNALAVTALLRLGKLTGRRELSESAETTLRLFRGLM